MCLRQAGARPEEEKHVAANLVLHHHEAVVPELNNSTWDRLLRHHTFLKKFVDFLKDQKAFIKMIEHEDLEHSKYALLRKTQWAGFPDEMEAFTKGEEIFSKSSIKTLLPLLEPYNSMIEGFQRPVDISVRNCLGEKEIGKKGEKAR